MSGNREQNERLVFGACRLTQVAAAIVLLTMLCAGTSQSLRAQSKDASTPAAVLRSAIGLWHFADTTNASESQSPIAVQGAAQLGVLLKEGDREASLARGGDGTAVDLNGGWLRVEVKASSVLDLQGEAFSALVRMKIPSGRWATRGFFTRGGGHDKLVWNFFSHDFEQGPSGMMVGCEIGVQDRPGLGGQVKVPVAQIGASDWHDLIVRYDGKELTLFVDGVPLDRRAAAGRLRSGNTEPLGIGAATAGSHVDSPAPGWIDHAAIWDRALTDSEVAALSGGAAEVAKNREKFARYRPPVNASPLGPSTTELVDRARQLRARYQADLDRPRYHFLVPEEGECMPADPNGAIFWKGRYHLFYIFQRRQASEPRVVHCWGHASSVDLVHWTHHPAALDVAEADPDRGIFSGNALLDENGVPTILYHGVGIGNAIARSHDDLLIHWKKSPANPIVPMPNPGEPSFGKYESWDPHGWREHGSTFAIFGGKTPALFKGPSLEKLAYVGPFLSDDRWSELGEDVSCPDFFSLGDRHLLLCISHRRGARYFLGRWEKERFIPESHGRMNWPGGGFFAPETMIDDRGRRILWAWVMDERPAARRVASGWSGVMSFPRVLSLDSKHRLRIEPADAWRLLAYNPLKVASIDVEPGKEQLVEGVRGKSLALSVRFSPAMQERVSLKLRHSPQSEEATVVEYDRARGVLSVDVAKSTLDPDIRYRSWCIFRPDDAADAERRVTVQQAPLTLDEGEPLELFILLDHSLLEVFANGRQCVTQRIFPTRDDADRVSIVAPDGRVHVERLEAWTMDAAGPGF